ncbi:MAG: phosphoribosylanthranilate isomerase [Gemmatimonadota bacterium]|nr:phosphoribosylanthranilate isomerase [Gemmatimonadota bacterium]
MTRAADARTAAELGADYVGVVFAGGPRRQDAASASPIFAALPPSVQRVGVFGVDVLAQSADQAKRLGLSVIQLHGDPTADQVAALREQWSGKIWASVRVVGAELPRPAAELFAVADAVLLEAKVEGALGGTGVALDWRAVADAVASLRRGDHARLVLAGGLKPENVAEAVRVLRPDVVDVSSGIEARVGIKDPARMRAFRDAVRSGEDAR